MNKIKRVLGLLLATSTIFTLGACSPTKEASSKAPTKQTLTFGVMGSIDAVPFIIAKEKGYFEKEGVDINIENFKNSKDRDAAFQAGTLDGVICDEVAISLYQNSDFDVKITGVTDGDFMLIAGKDSGIKSLEDIKGKSVAISEKTAIEYTLDKVLESKSLKANDVEKSVIPAIPTRLEMLNSNKVSAALLPEPFSSMAIANGGILLGSATELASYPSVSAFTQKSIDAKSSEIKSFYKAYNKAVNYINSTPVSEYEDLIIQTVGYPEEMKGKITLPKFRETTLPKDSEVQSAIDWCTNNKLIDKTLTSKDVMSKVGAN